MDKLDYWRLCDELSVVQAALLVAGHDPAEFPYVVNWQEHERPENFSAAFSALCHAVLGGRLPATIRRQAWERGWDEEPGIGEIFTRKIDLYSDQIDFPIEAETPKQRGIIYRATPDWNLTTVLVEDLTTWLRGRGFKAEFFLSQTSGNSGKPAYLDPTHEHYSPKLAAALYVWQAVNHERNLLKGKTVKQAMQKWLRQNADQFGLIKKDGKRNEQGIEEIAKVANWEPRGGQPKTPG
jgi:hypothetical protein